MSPAVTCMVCKGQYEKGIFLNNSNMSQPLFFHLAIPENGTTARLGARCGHWNWGGTVSSSMALWLWVIWGTATDQLCLIKIFYHTESRITVSTHETYQVQSASEQEILDSCCYSFSEREAGWEEGMRLGGSFTMTASYFPLWFLHVNLRVHKVHRSIPKLCHFPVIIVSFTVIIVRINLSSIYILKSSLRESCYIWTDPWLDLLKLNKLVFERSHVDYCCLWNYRVREILSYDSMSNLTGFS